MQDKDNETVADEKITSNSSVIESNSNESNTLNTSEVIQKAELELYEKLATAENKIAEIQDAFLRAKAESENVRRRAQEDINRAHKFAIESFAESLLAVKDSLEMALQVETPSVESLKTGVSMTLKQLTIAFEKNHLREIYPKVCEKLDPMKHQAISAVYADQEINTVVTVIQKGYTLSERLLRPALVTVAKNKLQDTSIVPENTV